MEIYEIKRLVRTSKRISLFALFCVVILITVQWQQTVPVDDFVTGDDSDNDNLQDDWENMSTYKYYKDTIEREFNGDSGMQQGTGWTHYEIWMNILRPKYVFTVNVSRYDGPGALYIVVGDEVEPQMNYSHPIIGSGISATPPIPATSNLQFGYFRVQLTSNLNFSIDQFLMESNSDWNNSDTDGDGLQDGMEDMNLNQQTDDEETSPIIADSDEDGLDDGDELTYGTNPLDSDSDDDGLSDGVEVNVYSTSPTDSDSDDDQLSDGYEVNTLLTNPLLSDTDSDNLTDYDEDNETYGYNTNPLDEDHDDDGLWDGDEVLNYGINPLLQGTDSDGLTDWDEIHIYDTDPNNASGDKDGDGLSDAVEENIYGTDLNDTDTDGDTIEDGDEVWGTYGYVTDPTLTDTDGDTLSDYFEIFTGWDVTVDGSTTHVYSDPTDDISYWSGSDLYDDYQNYIHGTDPWDSDTDNDGLLDSQELVIFRTNADDSDQDGFFEFNETGVWISTNYNWDNDGITNDDDFILYNFKYNGTVEKTFDNYCKVTSRTPDGYPIFYTNSYSYPPELYIFYEDPLELHTTCNAWEFTYDPAQLSMTYEDMLTGPNSNKYVKTPIQGLSDKEVWLDNTISDSDFDYLLDGEEIKDFATDPHCNDTDNDGVSDFVETSEWYLERYYYNPVYFEKVLASVNDTDEDGVVDGKEMAVKFRTNSFDGTYDSSSWIALNNGSVLYTPSAWMGQYSGFWALNESIRQSIDENYSRMIGYGYAGIISNFDTISSDCFYLYDNIHGDKVYVYNFSTIFVDVNPADNNAIKFNLSSDAASYAVTDPFPQPSYGYTELYNISLWLDPFCSDTDGDLLEDGDELYVYGSYPFGDDPDEDGVDDYDEINFNSEDGGYTPYTGESSTTDTNPLNPDTDEDGLWDGLHIVDENSKILHLGEMTGNQVYNDSNPLNNDTDGDGLLDGYFEGGEKGKLSFRSKYIVPINESIGQAQTWINETNARDELNGANNIGYFNISFDIAINYPEANELDVVLGLVYSGTDYHVSITNPYGSGNDNYFVTYVLYDSLNNILNYAYDFTSFPALYQAVALGHWYINVTDSTQVDGTNGTIERFEMNVEFRTDPSNNDTDNDGLTDWEEVTFGNYGWITNPCNANTDLDWINDYDEIHGTGDAFVKSNPNSIDTDSDGVSDEQDLMPNGNAIFVFEFTSVQLKSGVGVDGDNDLLEVYPVITYYNAGYFQERIGYTVPFNPSNKSQAMVYIDAGETVNTPSGDAELWRIIFDVPDFYNTEENEKWFYLRAYDDDGIGNDDDKLLLNSTEYDNGTYGFAYDLATKGNQTYITNDQNGTQVRFWFNVNLSVVTKMNTILVMPDNDTCSQNTTTGDLKFNVPDMSFTIIIVNVEGSGNSDFESGVNTILVPTPILFGSQFWNMTNSTSQANISNDLSDYQYIVNANWTMFNNTQATSQIQFTISFLCTASEASDLLSFLLHNATGNKTCWKHDITQSIYLNNLPTHVVSFSPEGFARSFRWAGYDEDPSYDYVPWFKEDEESRGWGVGWDAACAIGNYGKELIEDVTEFDYYGMVVYAFNNPVDFFKNIASAALVYGLGLAKSAADKYDDIKETVINAFNFFRDWIVNLVVHAFSSFLDTIGNLIEPYLQSYAETVLYLASLINEGVFDDDEGETRGSETDDNIDWNGLTGLILKISLGALVLEAATILFTGVILYIKAQSGGVLALIQSYILQSIKASLSWNIVAIISLSVVTEIINIFNEDAMDMPDYASIAISSVALSSSVVVAGITIAQVVAQKASISKSAFYIGLIFAIIGFFIDMTTNLIYKIQPISGSLLQAVDGVQLLFYGAGVLMMLINKDCASQLYCGKFAQIIPMLEFIAAALGGIMTGYSIYQHLNNDWEL